MRRSTAPTLKDVAAESGVSIMAASVVLNGAISSTRVSARTRERIHEAAARLGYVRNAVAVGLSRNRMNSVGVVSTLDTKETNLYFLDLINGIVEACAERGQSTKICAINDWLTDESQVLQLCDGRIDGLILISPYLSASFAAALPRHCLYVTIHVHEPNPFAVNLDIDNAASASKITRHLIERGHRRILHLTGTQSMLGARQRVQGYRRAIHEAGIVVEEALIVPSEYSIEAGRTSMEAYLERLGDHDLPTAVFCASDAVAFGCMEVLAARGLRVPQDISVAGFDDSFLAKMTRPALTTMRHPLRQMGRRAVDLLLELISEDQAIATANRVDPHTFPVPRPRPDVETFATELIERDSVGPPRDA